MHPLFFFYPPPKNILTANFQNDTLLSLSRENRIFPPDGRDERNFARRNPHCSEPENDSEIFTDEIEKKDSRYTAETMLSGRKSHVSGEEKPCSRASQALFASHTSILRVPHKHCSGSAQASISEKRSKKRIPDVYSFNFTNNLHPFLTFQPSFRKTVRQLIPPKIRFPIDNSRND